MAAGTRLRSSSFARIRLTWVLVVLSAIAGRCAICWLDSPAPRQASTSRSRGVRAATADRSAVGAAGALRANAVISRRVTAGAMIPSPRRVRAAQGVGAGQYGDVGAGATSRRATRA
jgi:hypothetical protein